MKNKANLFLCTTFVASLLGCQTPTKSDGEKNNMEKSQSAGDLCTRQSKKIVYVISSTLFPPKGMEIDKATEYLEERKAGMKKFSFNLPKVLTSGDGDVFGFSKIEVKKFQYIFFNDKYAPNAFTEPINNGKIISYIDSRNRYSVCRVFQAEDRFQSGLFGPVPLAIDDHSSKFDNNCVSPESLRDQDLFQSLFKDYYYTASDDRSSRLCLKAGMQSDCTRPLTKNGMEAFRTYASQMNGHFPFSTSYLMKKHLLGNGWDREREKYVESAQKDTKLQMEWKSEFTKDLLIKSMANVTTKIDGDWITYRVELDLTDLCEMRRPITELRVK